VPLRTCARHDAGVRGVLARRTTIAGTVGGIVWNPAGPLGLPNDDEADRARAFYADVDWALDVTDARFRSVPTLRYGPPGALIRRDPATQPLVTRARASAALEATGRESGVWWVVLDQLVKSAWPDDAVLILGLGGTKRRYETDLANFGYWPRQWRADLSPASIEHGE
jgi:hypothetical protein